MRYHPIALLLLVLAIAGAAPVGAQVPNREEVIRGAAQAGERTWRAANDPDRYNPSSRDLFTYALALCEARLYPERLARLFEVAEQMQCRDQAHRAYGNFRWNWKQSEVLDYNAVDFCMQGGSLLWLRHRDAIPEDARKRLREILEYAAQGLLNHRVPESYTNIALMNAGDLILLGEALDKPAVADEGYARLERVCLYTWEFGIHEYCSPTYYGTDLDDLLLIEAFCRRESGRRQAQALLELLWTDIALNWFPPSGRMAGAHSRSYDYLRGLGSVDTPLWIRGWPLPPLKPGLGAIFAAVARWNPPAQLAELSQNRFPRMVRQSWGISEREARVHYMLRDVTLSTAGAGYADMDMPLTVDLPAERTAPRCYFIPDGRHDPYGKAKIAAGGGHDKTLHLKPFFASAQRRGDALALAVYRKRDVPAGAATLESHFVVPLAMDGFWVGGRQVQFGSEPASYELKPGDALVLRRGTAAVGIRVPWSRGVDGSPAKAALVYDGNKYGAARLTVEHHGPQGVAGATAEAAVAFWVRIGGGMDDAAFERWRDAFAGARADVDARADRVEVAVQGVDGPVAVGTAVPYTDVTRVEPEPQRAVLDLDGEDLGRRILAGVEPIRSLAARKAAPPVELPRDRGAYLEAEAGQVVTPMVVGKDGAASGGAYVWMAGEPGARGGSSLGSVTWRLRVPRAGEHYLWGRVQAATPDDDSFFVRVLQGPRAPVDMATWPMGVHTAWEWVRVTLGDPKATAVNLPKGEVSIQLRVREDGAKIDRLFITPKQDEEPR